MKPQYSPGENTYKKQFSIATQPRKIQSETQITKPRRKKHKPEVRRRKQEKSIEEIARGCS